MFAVIIAAASSARRSSASITMPDNLSFSLVHLWPLLIGTLCGGLAASNEPLSA
jgi:hypothetical protein